jgi:hypothetical protein
MEESSSRPKRAAKTPTKFSPWEEGESSMMSDRKRKSREKGVKVTRKGALEKNKLYMREYRKKAKVEENGEEDSEEDKEPDREEREEDREEDREEEEVEGGEGGEGQETEGDGKKVPKSKKKKVTEILKVKMNFKK